jgi:hypothetical protein
MLRGLLLSGIAWLTEHGEEVAIVALMVAIATLAIFHATG